MHRSFLEPTLSMHRLSQYFEAQWASISHPPKRLIIACSGGLDSTVLLHLCAQLCPHVQKYVIHINHQLSPNAHQWQMHVERQSQRLNLIGISKKINLNNIGEGLEAEARKQRYAAIHDELIPGDWVVMAHHQQDQAETFLLRLMRGAGLQGLGAMASLRPWGMSGDSTLQLWRPLLNIEKSVILDYAQAHSCEWVEDESNQKDVFSRNYIRHQVWPLLTLRWPQAGHQVAQAAHHLQNAQTLLNEYLAGDLKHLNPRGERLGHSVQIAPMQNWTAQKCLAVVRYWLDQLNYRLPTTARLHQLYSLIQAAPDATPLLQLGDCEFRRYQGRLYCLPKGWQMAFNPTLSLDINGAFNAPIPWGWTQLIPRSQTALLAMSPYQIKPKIACIDIQRGHPSARAHSQTLKKLFQEYQLEPWLREWAPLLLKNGQLIAVLGLWVEKSADINVLYEWVSG